MRFLLISLFVFYSSQLAADPTPKTFELNASASFYTGDALRSTTLGGASTIYRFTPAFWLGADFFGGEISADQQNGLGMRGSEKFLLFDVALYWNLPVSLGLDSLSEMADLYGSIGLGPLWIADHRELFGFVGGGLALHTGWHGLAIRFDLKNLFFSLPNQRGRDFNSDMALALGPSILF